MIPISISINGLKKSLEVRPAESLLDLLRRSGYKSPKFGCGEGACGACTVLLDGRPVNSCLVLAATADGREVVTLESLGDQQRPHPIQQAFMDAGAIQCGFCTPGMILAAKALLDRKANPTEDEIRRALDGNLCRCTGYEQIFSGVKMAAQRLRASGKSAKKK
ncbi:MAG TPA: (2Fe-2S)-binding protein [bacterium]|nr:(2Fe-2S)-binding protein [bacterium]HPQ65466.1 (2Fe-2S)-binding protein [bacterium]